VANGGIIMVKVNEVFHPDPELKTLYFLYLLLGIVAFYLSWTIPIIIFVPHIYVIISILLPLLATIVFFAYWIPKYCSSVSFLLTENEIVVEKGVWWKKKSIVPYNRITNIDVVQGPLSRKFGIASIKIQTAGYSVAGDFSAKGVEAEIFGVKNYQEIRDFILNVIRGVKPVAVEVATETSSLEDIIRQILQELKEIRKLLKIKTT